MKGNRRNQPAAAAPSPPPPTSPTAKGTAKYTNKDGSKFITVPKPMAAEPAQASPPPPPPPFSPPANPGSKPSAETAEAAANGAPAVNRKKAKRRAKAAAKAKAEELSQVQSVGERDAGGLPSPAASSAGPAQEQAARGGSDGTTRPRSSLDDRGPYLQGNDDDPETPGKSKKPKKKKKKKVQAAPGQEGVAPAPPMAGSAPAPKKKIWNTSSQEEREQIKEFWLGLREDERKSLVKVEKDAVLKKMKEQQKHTCGCTVCGRKQNAIEEELEGLYDAYYLELEQYAHDPHHQGHAPPMMDPPRHYGSMRGMHSHAMSSSAYAGQQPSRGRIVEQTGDDDEEEDDDYSDDEEPDEDEDDDYSEGDEEDIPPDEIHRDYASDFFNFGNSLTVQGRATTPF